MILARRTTLRAVPPLPPESASRRSLPDLSVAEDDPLGAGQLAQATRAAGVVLVGADADLGTQAELAAVVEPGAGVDDHGRAVNPGHEAAGRGEITGHYGLGVR